MKHLLFLIIYFSSFQLFGFEIKNFANEDSVEVQLFGKYLIENHIIEFDTTKCLILSRFPDRISNSLCFEINNYNQNKLFNFKRDLEFVLIEKSTNKEIFDGFVIENHIIFNTIAYLKYAKPSFDLQFLSKHFEDIKINFPKWKKLKLDDDNFCIVNSNGKIKGSFNLIYKSKTNIGCFFSETSYLVNDQHYSEFFGGNGLGYEPAFIYWADQPKKYFKEGLFIGNEYYMFNSNHQLIHHGVSSDRLR